MATEDHNWHEIMNFGLLRSDFDLLSFSLKEHLFLSRQPTGTVSVTHPEVRKILLRAFAEIRIPQIKENYSNGNLAEAFARTLLWLLKGFPILILDPNDVSLKRLAAPFFSAAFERMNQLQDDLDRQNKTLQQRNYPVQVRMEKDYLPLFYLDGNERRRLERNTISTAIPPETLSPSALLRPLLQDFLFPTLAYVGGPAEIAYFAQLHPWYETMGIEQPKLFPRVSATLLPEITRKFLQAKGFQAGELFLKEDNLLDSLLSRSEFEQMKKTLREAKKSVEAHLTQIKESAGALDKTLKKSMETAERKINYQLQKVERKTFSALKRKNDVLYRQLVKARNVIYPGEKLQERYLNIFSFSTRLPDLIQELYQKIDPEVKGHQWIEI
jgi:uncharacterized protein YllA (UPF0747 family)